MSYIRIFIIACLGTLLVGCQSVKTTQAGIFNIDRQQSMSIVLSSTDVEQSAAKGYRDLVGQAYAKGAVSKDAYQTNRVREIASKLIDQVPVYRPDARSWKWEMVLLESSEVNAWCMAGGKMAVYTGLLHTIKPTDDELAAVIGHEIAHALREHSRESMSQQQGVNLVLGAADLALASSGYGNAGISKIATLGSNVLFILPHSREQELEADLIGLELMARAGYNPRAAKTLWQKMAKLGGSGSPEFLSTHPSSETRVELLSKSAERAYPLYRPR